MEAIFNAMDDDLLIPLVMVIIAGAIIYHNFKQKRAQKKELHDSSQPFSPPVLQGHHNPDLLSQAIYLWSQRDPFTIRDLTRSCAIFGATGSGKTTGSGAHLGYAIARHPKITTLILASKPEDRAMWQRIYSAAGRRLLIFGPHSPLRCNVLEFMQRHGADTRELTQAIMMISENLRNDESGRENDDFWQSQESRLIELAVVIVKLATGKVSAPHLLQFISGAAMSPDELNKESWQKGFHNCCLKAAAKNVRSSIDRNNYALALDYYLKEYPSMADKTRSSILVGVKGTLHVFNSGIVRELLSTTTNVAPLSFETDQSLLVDMPISSYGASGAFVLGAWKYLTEWYILKRQVTEQSNVIVLWSDEHQKVVNSFDAAFLAECRSHRGCMVTLTRSIHSYYTRLWQGGKHEADSYLTNFYHKIFHACGDDKTAAYASALIGRRLTTRVNSSMSPVDNPYDALFGQSKASSSTSQSIENIVENREFMQNLRTGGHENSGMVDGIVTRSGMPFSNGMNFFKVAFKQ